MAWEAARRNNDSSELMNGDAMKNWLKWSIGALIVTGISFVPSTDTGAGPASKKVALCHKGQTLELPESAVQAHLNHGDTLGPCSITPSQNK
jgi:hypothetical protein